MPSNFAKSDMLICRHFSAVELVELLELTTEDIFDMFPDRINEVRDELLELIE